ncbi:helix-turn-helix domain-containing protein [Streptomyces sp. NPDC050625]|uniref:helix-turn-helix domain-containing protein n=1 Tax=Streptomyces sp. NPDC050625 TaxID=3154629 RepID=UPI003446476C
MVFAAQGLDGAEKLLLLAYTNRTDDHGYCWPGQKRLIDDCGTSAATVKRAKASLIKKGLIASVRRVDPVTGDPITNLTRVNVPLLASMARPKTAYHDNVIEQLTFAPVQQTPRPQKSARTSPRMGSNQLKAHLEPDPGPLRAQNEPTLSSNRAQPQRKMSPPPAQNEPLNLNELSENPHLSPATGTPVVETAPTGPAKERKRQALHKTDSPSAPPATPTAAGMPKQRDPLEHQAAGSRIVAAYSAALGRPVLNGTRAKLEGQAVELLAQGLPEAWLCDRARELAARGWSDLVRHAERSTAPLFSNATAGSSDLPEWCGGCGKGTPAARHNARFRTLGELGAGEKCPQCHPDRVYTSG